MSSASAPAEAETSPIPTPTIPRRGLRAALHDSLVIMERSLNNYRRQPQIAVFVFIQPVMFVLLFRYVFGGSIQLGVPGFDYVQYLMPGIIVQSVAFSSIGTAIGIAEDLKAGIMDRFRSLPMAQSSVLAGKVLADTFVFMLTVFVMGAVGYLVGFRVTTSVPEALASLILIVAFGFAVCWIAAWIGLTLKEPEAVQSGGFVWMFPVVFASSVFVVPALMPGWLQDFAANNPVTYISDAARALTIGGYPCGSSIETIRVCTDAGTNLAWGLGWTAAIFVVFLGLSIRGWKRLD